MLKILISKNNRLYTSFLLNMLFAIVLTIVLLSTILFVNFESIVLYKGYTNILDSLSQVKQDVSVMITTGRTLSRQIYNDQYISKLLFYDNPDLTDALPAYSQLNSYVSSMPFISSIYIYNEKTKQLYNSTSKSNTKILNIDKLEDKELSHVLKNLQNYKISYPIPRSITTQDSNNTTISNYYSFLHYDKLTKNGSIVVLNISELWIHKIINENLSKSAANIFIINNKGLLVSDTWTKPMLSDLSKYDFIKTILSKSGSSYFVDEVEGKKSLIAYSEPDSLGWRYIKVTPYAAVISEINKMKSKTLVVVLIIILFGLSLSIILSKRLYNPLKLLLHKLTSLEREKRENLYLLKDELLRGLVTDSDCYTLEVLNEKFNDSGISLDPSGLFIIVLFKIDKYKHFVDTYNVKDRNLLKFSIANIAKEIFDVFFPSEVFYFWDEKIVVLLNLPTPEHSIESRKKLMELVVSVKTSVSKHLELSLSASLSSTCHTTSNLNAIYKEALETSMYRLFCGYGCILDLDFMNNLKSRIYNYPIEKETLLTNAIMLGKTSEAKRVYDEIIQNLSNYSFTSISMAISLLSYAIDNAIQNIYKNNFKEEGSAPSFIVNLYSVEIIDDINQMFYNQFEWISQKLNEKKTSKHENLLAKVNEIIFSQYCNPNLTLEAIADELSMSPKYLGRLYNQYTLTYIMEKVNELRIEKAKELLTSSKSTILEISETVGFSSDSYFHKNFKKQCGITPSEFRRSK